MQQTYGISLSFNLSTQVHMTDSLFSALEREYQGRNLHSDWLANVHSSSTEHAFMYNHFTAFEYPFVSFLLRKYHSIISQE